MNVTQVLIGIQARSTSKRLPNKCSEMIGEKRVLDYVIDSCNRSAHYLNDRLAKHGVFTRVAILIPEGDKIEQEFKPRGQIIQGPEDDVLTRYMAAARLYGADFIVRITGDCPLIPSPMISKMVRIANLNNLDYISNADEEVRTAIDGYDCEVMSRRMLEHLNKYAVNPSDREHVTTLARRSRPLWAKMGIMLDPYNLFADIKLSIDTQEDLDRVRFKNEDRERKRRRADELYGKSHVYNY